MDTPVPARLSGANVADLVWPIPMRERARLALTHEPQASSSPDGFRLATCVLCERPMVSMWHLWLDMRSLIQVGGLMSSVYVVKEIHMCHRCATDIYGAPTPDGKARPGDVDITGRPVYSDDPRCAP